MGYSQPNSEAPTVSPFLRPFFSGRAEREGGRCPDILVLGESRKRNPNNVELLGFFVFSHEWP